VSVMKLWLDDEREAPKGWVWVTTAKSAMAFCDIADEISLDHDLGDEKIAGTGYDVLLYLERMAALDPTFPIPATIHVHSANAGVYTKMFLAIAQIRKFETMNERERQERLYDDGRAASLEGGE
jgi:hypothetical protein